MNRALIIRASAVKRDPALATRGDRKLVVTELYPGAERPADAIEWAPPAAAEPCPVQPMPDTELAVFTERAKQTRHCHRRGTEIYTVLEGTMHIEIDGDEFMLSAGDTVVVNPGAFHEVRPRGPLLCQVVTVHCGGASDRFEH